MSEIYELPPEVVTRLNAFFGRTRSLGATALPRHSLRHGAFHSTWNECRRHLGLAGRLQPSRHVESGAMRTACSLAPSDARNTRRPVETPHRGLPWI